MSVAWLPFSVYSWYKSGLFGLSDVLWKTCEMSPEVCGGLKEKGHNLLAVGFIGNTENSLYRP